MAFRLDQLSAGDISALLAGANPAAGVTVAAPATTQFLLAPNHQPTTTTATPTAHIQVAPLGLNTPAGLAFHTNHAQPLGPAVNPPGFHPQSTTLLSALLEQQQREDQQKVAIYQRFGDNGLNVAARNDLALMLQQQQQPQQISIPLQAHNTAVVNPLNVATTGPQMTAVPQAAAVFRGQAQPGPDADVIAKYLHAQQQQQQQGVGEPSVVTAASTTTNQVPLPAPTGPTFAATTTTAAQPNNSIAGVPAPVVAEGNPAAIAAPVEEEEKKCSPAGGGIGTFPMKLHQMLSDLEQQEGGAEIASFLPHGRAFEIHRPRDFVKLVMPKYFRMGSYSSFQRQLNLYDFQRISEGPDKGSYYHELFVQGRPVLASMVKRNKIKGVRGLKQQEDGGNDENNDGETKEEAPEQENEEEQEEGEDEAA